jgi:multiple RNA-binding domain-containing protein 1
MENTRVFVSGLPPTISNQDLGKHFGSRFQVTDVHVIPKRRIGFVGFKEAAHAKQAVDYFNKTYIRMSKISVEIARPVSVLYIPLLCFLYRVVQADRSRWF